MYRPFGPRTNLSFGNGLPDRRHDFRYRQGLWTLGSAPNYLINYDNIYDNDDNLSATWIFLKPIDHSCI